MKKGIIIAFYVILVTAISLITYQNFDTSAKARTFKDFCRVGITIVKPGEITVYGVTFNRLDRRVIGVTKDCVIVVDQGHFRHSVARRKFRRQLKQRGII